MLKYLLTLFICVTIGKNTFAQNQNEDFVVKKYPVRLIAHTDSSLFLLSQGKNEKGKWDFYISKHAVDHRITFDACLDLNKLFSGKFDPETFRYQFLQCENNIILVFDVIIEGKKTVIGKFIGYDGKLSEAMVLDKWDMSDDNLAGCSYIISLTANKDILIALKRTYKSGYQRDKYLLYSDRFAKFWEYELPKINSHTELNIVADVDNQRNLIYFIANYHQDIFHLKSLEFDSLVKLKLGYLNYDLIIRRDSIELHYVYPNTGKVIVRKIYYPFVPLPAMKSLSASQILLYNLVDIDDEKYMFPAKKAMYYKRVDVKNNLTLLDTLYTLSDKVQQALTYYFNTPSDRPTNKSFRLISERIINGKLITVFEHGFTDAKYELLVSSYDISQNKFDWVKFIPKKTEVLPDNFGALCISHFNEKITISFYEHKDNFNTMPNAYSFRKFETAKKPKNIQFISLIISSDGSIEKKAVDENAPEVIFPWITDKNYMEKARGFESRYFLPNGFLFN